ncbi:MAG: hypothetical protein OXS29_09550 [bacterium]|nr:hypothetical protein [bacterium]MDE0289678.1 hypothetical protein [bacterium]MDE0439891.1 hypothetical protein [bacterium]
MGLQFEGGAAYRHSFVDALLLGRHTLEMPLEFGLADERQARERLLGLVRASPAFYSDPSPAEFETALNDRCHSPEG